MTNTTIAQEPTMTTIRIFPDQYEPGLAWDETDADGYVVSGPVDGAETIHAVWQRSAITTETPDVTCGYDRDNGGSITISGPGDQVRAFVAGLGITLR